MSIFFGYDKIYKFIIVKSFTMNALVATAKSAPALAVIRSLGKKSIEVTGASDSGNAYPFFSKYCKNRILLKSPQNRMEDFIDELYGIIKHKKFDVFLPVMPEDFLLALSQRKVEFEQFTRLALPSVDQFKMLNDKGKVSELMTILNLPCPVTYFTSTDIILDSLIKEIHFPVIVKPRRGEGAKGVKIVSDPSDLQTAYAECFRTYGPCLVQEFISGDKYTAVFLLNNNSEVRRFFVHRAIREYPISGGPTCFLESVKYEPIFEYGMKLLKAAHFAGLVSMEFIIDKKDNEPKIIDVNPRFYGPLQCAIAAGVDLPYDVYRLVLAGDIETDLSYREGVTCRHLLFEDTKHLISVLRGAKSPKYTTGKTATLINFLKFHRDDSYFVLSASDPMPAIRKIFFDHLVGYKSLLHERTDS